MQFKRLFLTAMLVCALAFVGCGKGDGGGGGGGDVSVQEGGPAAGGSKAAPAEKPLPDALASLVPTNAVALVYVRAPADLEGKIKSLMARIDPEKVDEVDLGAMVGGMLQGAGEHWDASKPMAVAVPLPGADQGIEDAMQGMTMIFGMKDAAAAKTAMEAAIAKQMKDIPEKYRPKPEEQPKILVSGNYLTMSRGPAAARGGAKIAETAPDSDVGLRIDLAALVGRYRKDIDAGLAEMEKGMEEGLGELPPGASSLGGMFKGLASGLHDFVDSAEMLDIGVSVDGGHVELAFGFVAKEGSKLDKPGQDPGGLAKLAAHLPQDMPVSLLMSMDMGSLMEWVKPLMEAGMEQLPEDQRAKFKSYIDETSEMTKLLGPDWAVAFSMGDKGMELVELVACKDAATYLQRTDKLFASDVLAGMPGISGKKTGTTKVSGVDVHTYDLTIDIKKMMAMQAKGQDLPPEVLQKTSGFVNKLLGGDALTFHVAAVENKLLFTMGGPARMAATIESVRGGGKLPAALESGIQRAGGAPTFMLHMDVRTLAKQIISIAREMVDEEMPAVPAGAPIPVLVWGKHDGRVYGGGLKVDVGGVVDMVKAMKK